MRWIVASSGVGRLRRRHPCVETGTEAVLMSKAPCVDGHAPALSTAGGSATGTPSTRRCRGGGRYAVSPLPGELPWDRAPHVPSRPPRLAACGDHAPDA